MLLGTTQVDLEMIIPWEAGQIEKADSIWYQIEVETKMDRKT